jgi:hypothetical protein
VLVIELALPLPGAYGLICATQTRQRPARYRRFTARLASTTGLAAAAHFARGDELARRRSRVLGQAKVFRPRCGTNADQQRPGSRAPRMWPPAPNDPLPCQAESLAARWWKVEVGSGWVTGEVGGDGVGGVPVRRCPGAGVPHGGSGVGVRIAFVLAKNASGSATPRFGADVHWST